MKDSSKSLAAVDIAKEKNQLMKLLSSTRTWMSILASGLVLVFGWLKLKGVSIIPLTSDSFTTVLLRGSMILYFFSWVFGASWDAHDQGLVYLTAPNKGRIPVIAIFLMIIITLVFGILCWVDSYVKFAAVLGIFWLVNLIAWQYMMRKLVGEVITKSSTILLQLGHHLELARLHIVRDYLSGSWQWWRFCIGAVLIICINVLANTNVPNDIKAATNVLSAEFVMVFSIFLFVAVVELWIWVMRIKRRISLNLLDDLGETYKLEPKL